MNRLFKLQFLGPLALFVATLGAELAARALSYAPDSEILWFVNLRMFGIFQRSHGALADSSRLRVFSCSASPCRYSRWHVLASPQGLDFPWRLPAT
jgi:hypothetical protein